MSGKPEEISSIIQERIKNFNTKLKIDEIGTILSVGDGIVRAFGLRNVMAGEYVEFDSGSRGMVLNLEENNVGIALFENDLTLKEGSRVKRTGKRIT